MAGPFQQRHGQGATIAGPALGVLETSSVARGLVVADQMVKRAPAELVLARPVSSGKLVIVIAGAVADVEEAMAAGLSAAGATLVDRLQLSLAADALLTALAGHQPAARPGDALGIFETFSIASSLLAADAACKSAEVALTEFRLADGLGGKAYFILSGDQADVEAALLAAEHATPTGMLLAHELIPRPHDDLFAQLRRRE